MYTPLRFMQQLESMVSVPKARSLELELNAKTIEWFDELIESQRDSYAFMFALGWSNCLHDIQLPKAMDVEYKRLMLSYTVDTGLMAPDKSDFFFMGLMYLIHNNWTRNKRVYNIEKEMLTNFCYMKPLKLISADTVLKLPTKCFYMDWEDGAPFCKDATGCFVTYDVLDDSAVFYITVILDHARILPIVTLFYLRDIANAHIAPRIDQFQGDRVIDLEDGTTTVYNEQMAVRMFYNFCIYLSAMNSDVTYTERTKKVYRKRSTGSKPQNKMREVEEFGVGFKYQTVKPKVRVKYVGDEREKDANDESSKKRAYSSHYRDAHWHHYWINDPDEDGKRKLIVKWLNQTYVHGNVDLSDTVKVSKVISTSTV